MNTAKILIVYYSSTGNTRKMAEFAARGVKEENIEVELKNARDTAAEDLLEAQGIILGSPTYYGLPAQEIMRLLEDSVKYHGRLEGKAAGAFSSSANIGGGNETTIMALVEAFLVHGMVVQGTSRGDHYGPVSIGKPDARVEEQCMALGRRVASLAKKLSSGGH